MDGAVGGAVLRDAAVDTIRTRGVADEGGVWEAVRGGGGGAVEVSDCCTADQ